MNERTKKALEDLKRISDDYGGEIASVATSAAAVISELSYRINRLIPVTERLPECNALFCDKYGDIYRGHYNKGDRTFFEDGFMDKVKNVVAWMPLPEPYRESEG